MRSLLLEGGPTLGSSFLAADLVDKLLVFVAPTIATDLPTSHRLFRDELVFGEGGLIPAIVQDDKTGQVLCLYYMNRTAIEKTIETGIRTAGRVLGRVPQVRVIGV